MKIDTPPPRSKELLIDSSGNAAARGVAACGRRVPRAVACAQRARAGVGGFGDAAGGKLALRESGPRVELIHAVAGGAVAPARAQHVAIALEFTHGVTGVHPDPTSG